MIVDAVERRNTYRHEHYLIMIANAEERRNTYRHICCLAFTTAYHELILRIWWKELTDVEMKSFAIRQVDEVRLSCNGLDYNDVY